MRNQVTVDRDNHRARVVASVLPGAGLAAYHLLELRVAALEQGWSVEIVPPPTALPTIPFEDDAPTQAGRAALAEAIWGAKRLGLAIDVRGPVARVKAVTDALAAAGITARRVGGGSAVSLGWAVPAPTSAPVPAPAMVNAPTPPQ